MSINRTVNPINLLLLVPSLLLSACVAGVGHRQIIQEDGFYLEVNAPDKETKAQIQFTSKLTALDYMPEETSMYLAVEDADGFHQLTIFSDNGNPNYEYKINGNISEFGANERKWFSAYSPSIANTLGVDTSN